MIPEASEQIQPQKDPSLVDSFKIKSSEEF